MNQLLSYSHGVIKASAYEALLTRNNQDPFGLLPQALNDSLTLVHYRFGCGDQIQLLGEYLFERFLYIPGMMPPPPLNSYRNVGLSSSEIDELLSIYKIRRENREVYMQRYFAYH